MCNFFRAPGVLGVAPNGGALPLKCPLIFQRFRFTELGPVQLQATLMLLSTSFGANVQTSLTPTLRRRAAKQVPDTSARRRMGSQTGSPGARNGVADSLSLDGEGRGDPRPREPKKFHGKRLSRKRCWFAIDIEERPHCEPTWRLA